MLAPIALFVYNRPWHTKQTVEALAKNSLASESELYIFSDAPKDEIAVVAVNEVRNYIREVEGFRKIEIIEQPINKGIEASEIEGITEIINKFGKIIVLEDDLYTSAGFLKFINDGLNIYQNTNVFSVNGFMFPIGATITESFLCPLGTTSWGWGTWKNKWDLLEKGFEYKNIIASNSIIRDRFNFGGYNYLSILEMETWDIRWYYTSFIRNGLGLFPSKSLIKNIGFDGSGVHYSQPSEIYQDIHDGFIDIYKTDKIDFVYYDKLLKYYQYQFGQTEKNNSFILKAKDKFNSLFFKK